MRVCLLLLASLTYGVLSTVLPATASERHFGLQASRHNKDSFLDSRRTSPEEDGEEGGRTGKGQGQPGKGQGQRDKLHGTPGSALDAPDIFDIEEENVSTKSYPGLVFAIAFMLTIALVLVCVNLSAREAEEQSDEELFEKGIDPERWKEFADKGELEIYTCMALDVGAKKEVSCLIRWLPKIFMPFCTQIGLALLLSLYNVGRYEDHQLAYVPYVQSSIHRFIGFLLFSYSSWILYESMLDDCRTEILRFTLCKNVSGWYSWPIYFGEIINTFITVVLIVVLYLIFNDCSHPRDLLVNCLAINFVGDIDNHIVSARDQKESLNNIDTFNADFFASKIQPELMRQSELFMSRHLSEHGRTRSISRRVTAESEEDVRSARELGYILQMSILLLNRIIRFLIPFMVMVLAFVFLFANNVKLCNHMRDIDPWPFCYGTHY